MLITAKKQTKLKEHEIKTDTEKKKREEQLDRTEKNQSLHLTREKPNFYNCSKIIKSPEFLKGPIFTEIGKRGTLFVTRWLQVVTISYLTDSFEIIIMPKEMFFITIMANKFKSSF